MGKPTLSPTHSHAEGVVYKKSLGTYFVHTPAGEITCSISSRLRKELIYPIADLSSIPHHRVQEVRDIRAVDPVAIGDCVRFLEAEDGIGVITEVLPRRNKLARSAAGKKELEQVIAANIDQIVMVFAAARPEPKWNLLDRYLVTAEAAEIPALICLTKLDLIDEGEFEDELNEYRTLGYPVLRTSVIDQRGIDALRDALKDKTSVLIGKSGVGKTSLLNEIQPGLGLRVGEISRALNKGKHTTTHLEMISLDIGGGIIDTPGMREFEAWDLDGGDLALMFPEMRPLVGKCRFGLDCTHTQEPGCAIIRGVAQGHVSERRYHSYVRMLE
jgi:ribosome biogenesis GTPase